MFCGWAWGPIVLELVRNVNRELMGAATFARLITEFNRNQNSLN